MTADTLSILLRSTCWRCDGVLVVTADALGRTRERCPVCQGVNRITTRLAPEHLMVRQQASIAPPVVPVRFERNRSIVLAFVVGGVA